MKLFVTGSTGFIGSHFVEIALYHGHEVIGHRRSITTEPRISLKLAPKWRTCSLDELSEQDFQGVDCLVHLAAHSANPPYDELEQCIHWNVLVPLKLLRIASNAGVGRAVVAGSCFEYGRSGARYNFIPVDAPLEPVGTYPTSKAMASLAFIELAKELDFQLSIHRLFHVYGEGELENRLWPSLRHSAKNGEDYPMTLGEQIRDFISVERVANNLLEACYNTSINRFQTLIENVGTGNPQSVLDFSQYWWNHWNAKGKLLVGAVPYRSNEVMRFVPELSSNAASIQ